MATKQNPVSVIDPGKRELAPWEISEMLDAHFEQMQAHMKALLDETVERVAIRVAQIEAKQHVKH